MRTPRFLRSFGIFIVPNNCAAVNTSKKFADKTSKKQKNWSRISLASLASGNNIGFLPLKKRQRESPLHWTGPEQIDTEINTLS